MGASSSPAEREKPMIESMIAVQPLVRH